MVPKARTLIYTNGDYLTRAYVQDLADAGLQYMHVSIHMAPDDKYSDVYALDRISEVTTRMGVSGVNGDDLEPYFERDEQLQPPIRLSSIFGDMLQRYERSKNVFRRARVAPTNITRTS